MDIAALQETFISDPLNPKVLEQYQNALLEAGDPVGLREMHGILFDHYSADAGLEAFLRQTDMKARTAETPELSAELYGSLGRLHWKKGENPDRAELYFRRLKGQESPFEGMIHEFYVGFYVKF